MKSLYQGVRQTSKHQFGLTFSVQINVRDMEGKHHHKKGYLKQRVPLSLVHLFLLSSALQGARLAYKGARS